METEGEPLEYINPYRPEHTYIDNLHIDFWECLQMEVAKRDAAIAAGVENPPGLTYEESIQAWSDMMINGPPL